MDAFCPGAQVGKPGERAVGGEGDVPAPARGGGFSEPVVDIGADERGWDARVGGELAREGDRLVADIDAGDVGAELREAQGVLPGVALQVHDAPAAEVAEEAAFFGVELVAAFAEELCLVALVAVMGLRRFVPREAVLIVEVAARARLLVHGYPCLGRVPGAKGSRPGRPCQPADSLTGSAVRDDDGAMTRITIDELREHLDEYLARVRKGETVVVCEEGKEAVRLTPAESSRLPVVTRASLPPSHLDEITPVSLPPGLDPLEVLRESRADRFE